MTETLAHGYSSESTHQELSCEYQHDRVWMVFIKSLRLCALDESGLSNGRVKSVAFRRPQETSCWRESQLFVLDDMQLLNYIYQTAS